MQLRFATVAEGNQLSGGVIMSGNITSEAIVAYSQCERKAYFVLHGESKSNQHDLDRVLNERGNEESEDIRCWISP